MVQGELISPWHGDRILQIARDYEGMTISETTGQLAESILPDPNLVTTHFICDEATLTSIENDATYYIVWSEEIVEDIP